MRAGAWAAWAAAIALLLRGAAGSCQAPADEESAPPSRIATACVKAQFDGQLRNGCTFPVDIVYCLDAPRTSYSCDRAAPEPATLHLHLAAKARAEWPSGLRQLLVTLAKPIAMFACRSDPADPVTPVLERIDPPFGTCD